MNFSSYWWVSPLQLCVVKKQLHTEFMSANSYSIEDGPLSSL